MFPDPSQAPVELQTISVTAELLTSLVQLRNNIQVSQRNCIDRVVTQLKLQLLSISSFLSVVCW